MVPCCRSIWLCSSVQTSAKKGKQFVSSTKWRLGENVIFRLMECLTPTFSLEKFMNNYSKSFGLLTHLGVSNIRATGVLNKNRLRKCTIVGNRCIGNKRDHGHFELGKSSKTAVQLLLEQQQSVFHSFF